jgi:tetratricopeptide (TPR) repeat protein
LATTTEIDSFFSSTITSVAQLDGLANSALSRGIDRYTAKDYTGAVNEFKRALSLSPSSDNAPKAYEYLANTFLKLGKTNEAIKTDQAAIKAFPADDTIRIRMGDLFYKLNKFDEAITQYAKAVSLNPNSADNRYSLGMANLSGGRLKEAETQFTQVTQLDSKNPIGFYGLGQVSRLSGEYDDALVQLNRAVKIDKTFANAYLELGYTYTDMKDLDQAQKQVEMLDRMKASSQSIMLQGYMTQTAPPKFILIYSPNYFSTHSGPNTEVAALDSTLSTPGSTKNFTLSFSFSKDMNIDSVENLANWQISRQTGEYFYQRYNNGNSISSTEVSTPSGPDKVIYDPENRTALVKFTIAQNDAADGTIDPSHLLFQFSGKDSYGKYMDSTGDEYSGFSLII